MRRTGQEGYATRYVGDLRGCADSSGDCNGEESRFFERVREGLNKIDPAVLAYDESEFWMVQAQYEFIEYYAVRHRYHNTALALPLARGLHDGVHRKFSVIKDGVQYKVPYLIHPLRVCHVLIDLRAALSPEEEDIMLAAALCHDVIEDIPLPLHGRELTEVYGMDRRVYDTVLKVTKQRNAAPKKRKSILMRLPGISWLCSSSWRTAAIM